MLTFDLCPRCHEPVRAVRIRHASGRITVHHTCKQGHPQTPEPVRSGALQLVRGRS